MKPALRNTIWVLMIIGALFIAHNWKAPIDAKAETPSAHKYEQKVVTYVYTDQKSLSINLESEAAAGWEVTASAFDPKQGSLIVFYKKLSY